MEPKIKNATFATQCNPYQNMRYNSESEYIILMGDVFGFLRPGVKFCVSDIRQSQEWHWKAGRILA